MHYCGKNCWFPSIQVHNVPEHFCVEIRGVYEHDTISETKYLFESVWATVNIGDTIHLQGE